MAGKLFHYPLVVTPANNPETLFQIRTPANGRSLLHAIELMPKGSTPAAAPLVFQLASQDTAGSATDDSAAIVKEVPVYPGSTLATIFKTWTVEPVSTKYYDIALHQQARLRWTPPTKSGFLVLEQSTRWGLLYVGAAPGFAIELNAIFEE